LLTLIGERTLVVTQGEGRSFVPIEGDGVAKDEQLRHSILLQ